MKKLFAFLMSLSLVFAMTFTSFATETVTVNTDLKLHTFDVYQVLKGDQTDSDSTLANVAWGDGINVNEFIADITALEVGDPATCPFADVATAANTAEKFAEILADNEAYAEEVAEIAYANKTTKTTSFDGNETIVNFEKAGYYLFVDTTIVEGSTDARNKALLQVTKNGNIEIGLKTLKPEFKKEVKDNEDGTTWGEHADYKIGDAVPFKLTATFPAAQMDQFDTYAIKITDTYDTNEFTSPVITDLKVSGTSNDALKATVDINETDGTIIFEAADIKDYAKVDDKITIEIEFTLNLASSASVSATNDIHANVNNATLEFSNDPNEEGKGSISDNANVYTYKVVLNKKDASNGNAPLANVGFKLSNGTDYLQADGTWAATEYEFTTDASGQITFSGLDEGTYTLIESSPLPGYNAIADQNITITADDDADSAPTTITINNDEQTIEVSNKKGSVLPETGGMGTTLFYVLGGALVIVAGVILVSRKRMEK